MCYGGSTGAPLALAHSAVCNRMVFDKISDVVQAINNNISYAVDQAGTHAATRSDVFSINIRKHAL